MATIPLPMTILDPFLGEQFWTCRWPQYVDHCKGCSFDLATGCLERSSSLCISILLNMRDFLNLRACTWNSSLQGLLDDQFKQLQMLQEWGDPDFIVDVVTLFYEDGERIIGEIAKLLDKPCVDYDKVDGFVHQLMGNSACLGAQRVKNSCIQFHQCCQQKSRDGLVPCIIMSHYCIFYHSVIEMSLLNVMA